MEHARCEHARCEHARCEQTAAGWICALPRGAPKCHAAPCKGLGCKGPCSTLHACARRGRAHTNVVC
eukprot:360592-Chlamydomonas_euryale.AAC.1